MEKYVVTMLGEKDHGKSTLIGSLLMATKSTTEDRIREAKRYSKGKFEPAFILDSFSEEREQEMTIDTTRAEVLYKNKMFELIDVPGHIELMKNMMSGASHGELAILLVSVKKGEGLQPQTKRHIFISNMLGVKGLIVAVNKMDLVDYDEACFKKTKKEISDYLDSVGFSKPVSYVPISAYNGENLLALSKNMKWYKGKPVVETLMQYAKMPEKRGKRGTRALVQDVLDEGNRKLLFCLLYSGTIRLGESLRLEPEGTKVTAKEIHVKGKSVKLARSGTNLAISVDKKTRVERGNMICGSSERPFSTKRFEALVFLSRGLSTKDKTEMKINNNTVTVGISRIHSIISPVTGRSSAPKSNKIAANGAAKMGFEFKAAYPIEKAKDYKDLGRFSLYAKGKFVGIGIVV